MTEKLMPVGDAFVEVIGYLPTHQTIRRLVLTRKIKGTKMLGAWWCSLSDLREYMAQTTAAAMSPDRTQTASTAGNRSRSDAAKAKAQADSIAYLEANGIN